MQGEHLLETLSDNKKSFGVDISMKQINYAKKNYENKNHRFFYIKKNIIPFKKNFFDVITNLQLIEHLTIEDNIKLMKETYRVLKKEGKLIITTPNYSSPWILLEKICKFFW